MGQKSEVNSIEAGKRGVGGNVRRLLLRGVYCEWESRSGIVARGGMGHYCDNSVCVSGSSFIERNDRCRRGVQSTSSCWIWRTEEDRREVAMLLGKYALSGLSSLCRILQHSFHWLSSMNGNYLTIKGRKE